VRSSYSDRPATRGDVLEFGSLERVSCHTNTTTLIRISATVTTGKRSVGMLSFRGSRGDGA
jgi:hypothetical protein